MDTSASVEPIQFSSVLVKVASRCNLACDYCYMYEHADQSWRLQPRFLSRETQDQLVGRISEYLEESQRDRFSVIFHGGEPLLAGVNTLTELADRIRSGSPAVDIDVGIQTNGLLLQRETLASLADHDIGVSLSLDGPAHVHDVHRRRAGGQPSHSDVMAAFERLQERPDVFSGVIAVIDPTSDASELVDWFGGLALPALDLLLPDANHGSGLSQMDHTQLSDWLVEAFDTWFDRFPHLRIRTFDALLESVAGLPSQTDAFGFGDVSLVCVETDGSYEDLDVLRITHEGRTKLDRTLAETRIAELADHPKLLEHRSLLDLDGAAETCRTCPEVQVCGGGALPHRFDPNHEGIQAWRNPSVYCEEMYALIRRAREKVAEALSEDRRDTGRIAVEEAIDWPRTDAPGGTVDRVSAWGVESLERLGRVLGQGASGVPVQLVQEGTIDPKDEIEFAISPQVQFFLHVAERTRSGGVFRDPNGRLVTPDEELFFGWRATQGGIPHLHRDDPVLRLPFRYPIEFLPYGGADIELHRTGFALALEKVGAYSQSLAQDLGRICPEIQFIRDAEAHPEKSVSFSDDVLPGVLFVAPPQMWDEESVFDTADSLIHEYRHQKLYLIGRQTPLVAVDWPLISSPWRPEPRPPSGLLHALFVFVELMDYWQWVRRTDASLEGRAEAEIRGAAEKMSAGFETLQTTRLTDEGRRLQAWLQERFRRTDAEAEI